MFSLQIFNNIFFSLVFQTFVIYTHRNNRSPRLPGPITNDTEKPS